MILLWCFWSANIQTNIYIFIQLHTYTTSLFDVLNTLIVFFLLHHFSSNYFLILCFVVKEIQILRFLRLLRIPFFCVCVFEWQFRRTMWWDPHLNKIFHFICPLCRIYWSQVVNKRMKWRGRKDDKLESILRLFFVVAGFLHLLIIFEVNEKIIVLFSRVILSKYRICNIYFFL